jgi:hypothetical protein
MKPLSAEWLETNVAAYIDGACNAWMDSGEGQRKINPVIPWASDSVVRLAAVRAAFRAGAQFAISQTRSCATYELSNEGPNHRCSIDHPPCPACELLEEREYEREVGL